MAADEIEKIRTQDEKEANRMEKQDRERKKEEKGLMNSEWAKIKSVGVIKGLHANKLSDNKQKLKVAKQLLTNSGAIKDKIIENKREFEQTNTFIVNRVRMCRLKRTGKNNNMTVQDVS